MQLFDEIDQVTSDYRRVVLGIEDEPEFSACAECNLPDVEYDEGREEFLCEECQRKSAAEYAEHCRLDSPTHEPRS